MIAIWCTICGFIGAIFGMILSILCLAKKVEDAKEKYSFKYNILMIAYKTAETEIVNKIEKKSFFTPDGSDKKTESFDNFSDYMIMTEDAIEVVRKEFRKVVTENDRL